MTAAEIAARVAAGELSAEEVVADALARIAARPELNAVITICEEQALARARAGVSGALAGVPVLDQGPHRHGGRAHDLRLVDLRRPRPGAQRPRRDGARGAGRDRRGQGNLDEFAWGVCGQNTFYGDTVNPTRPDRVAGGSSSGNAAALAAGMSRWRSAPTPAARCASPPPRAAWSGSRRRWGAVPVEGVFPLAASFDTVGPMARTVADCALAHAVLTGDRRPGAGDRAACASAC